MSSYEPRHLHRDPDDRPSGALTGAGAVLAAVLYATATSRARRRGPQPQHSRH